MKLPQSLADQMGCTSVDTNVSDQFVKVWILCLVYGVVMFTAITLPLFWCFRETKRALVEVLTGEADDSDKLKSAAAGDEPLQPDEQADPDIKDIQLCIERAEEHLLETSATRRPNLREEPGSPKDAHGKAKLEWRSLWRTKISDIALIGGTGTELYFRLLMQLGLVFTYMTCFSSPIVGYSILGNFAPDTGAALLKTTIGNMGTLTNTSLLPPQSRYTVLACQGVPLSQVTSYFGWLDFGSVLVFLVFMLYFRYSYIPRKVEEDDADQITCKDFALMVEKLPRQIKDTDEHKLYSRKLAHCLEEEMARLREEESKRKKALKASLQAMGLGTDDLEEEKEQELPIVKVNEVTLVRDFGGRLADIRNKAELELRFNIADDKGDEKQKKKLGKKIRGLMTKISKSLKDEDDLPVVRAYVIANTQSDVEMILNEHRLSRITVIHWIQRLACRCCWTRIRFCRGLRFEDKPIRLDVAPEPSNIIWENQDTPWLSRSIRKCVMLIVFLILIAISLVLIYACSVSASSQASTQQSYTGVLDCDPAAPKFGAKFKCDAIVAKNYTTDFVVNASNTDITSCFCQTQGYSKIFQSDGLRSLCQGWVLDSVKSSGITIGATVITVVINTLVKSTLLSMAQVEKPVTETEMALAVTRKISLAQTINTGLVVLLVNYNAPEDLRDAINRFPLGGQLIFAGSYPDFVRSWYSFVGTALLTNMLANAFVAPATNVVMVMVLWTKRRLCRKRQKHYAEMLELYTNPPFDLTARFAQLIMTVYVTLMYSAGLPALNLFAAGYMFFMYWSDKFVLLWGSHRPPMHDAQLSKEVAGLLLYAVPIHCVLACCMYGQPCTFPTDGVGYASSVNSLTGNVENSYAASHWIYTRVSRGSTWMHFALLVLLVAVWVLSIVYFLLSSTILRAVSFLVTMVQTCCCWCNCWTALRRMCCCCRCSCTLKGLLTCFFSLLLLPFQRCLRCCRKNRQVQDVPDQEGGPAEKEVKKEAKVGENLDWKAAKKLIDELYPPSSYALEESPAWEKLRKYVAKGELTKSHSRIAMDPEEEETGKRCLPCCKGKAAADEAEEIVVGKKVSDVVKETSTAELRLEADNA